ncbi:MAG: LPS assembly protein LptD [Wigglesworthia glossinidia]|nr:LPS assembly protein LptD [Wigglesworthia glossinidia]
MKKLIYHFFLLTFFILYSIKISSKIECRNINVTQKNKNFSSYSYLKKNELHIYSDLVKMQFPNKFFFIGNAKIYQNQSLFLANKFQIIQEKQHTSIMALGNAKYIFNKDFYIKGSRAFFDNKTGNFDFYEINYHFFKDNILGGADLFQNRNSNRLIILKNGYIQLCSYKCPFWKISGSKIVYDRQKKIIKIWNSKISFKNIPVLYLPYLKMKLDNNFNSFIPRVSYNNNTGISILFLYRLHIFNNSYFHIIPKYTSMNGLEINNYFYNTGGLNNQKYINFHWIENRRNNNALWMLRSNYEYQINKNINANLYYKNSNNLIYFIKNILELNKNFINNNIRMQLKLHYKNYNWEIKSVYREFYSNIKYKNTYNINPYLWFQYNIYNNKYFNFQLFGKLIHFRSQNVLLPQVTYTYIVPKFYTILFYSGVLFKNEIKTIITNRYDYDNRNNLLKITKQYIPQFKLDINLLKNIIINFKNYFQGIDLKAQYIYVPYYKNNNVVFDKLYYADIDYFNIFQKQFQNIVDQISYANKIALEWNSYIYDNKNFERFNISFKKIFHLSTKYKKELLLKYADFFGISNWIINQNLQLNSSINLYQSKKELLEFRTKLIYEKNYNYYSLEYRFLNQDWMHHLDFNQKNISEVKIFGKFSFKKEWSISASSRYNMYPLNYLKNIFSLQYDSYCLTYKLQYIQELDYENIYRHKFNQKIFFNISIS